MTGDATDAKERKALGLYARPRALVYVCYPNGGHRQGRSAIVATAAISRSYPLPGTTDPIERSRTTTSLLPSVGGTESLPGRWSTLSGAAAISPPPPEGQFVDHLEEVTLPFFNRAARCTWDVSRLAIELSLVRFNNSQRDQKVSSVLRPFLAIHWQAIG
jgi:hypothetical protein